MLSMSYIINCYHEHRSLGITLSRTQTPGRKNRQDQPHPQTHPLPSGREGPPHSEDRSRLQQKQSPPGKTGHSPQHRKI